MSSKSSTTKPGQSSEQRVEKDLTELKSRVERNEFRARDMEAQARMAESHIRLIKARAELAGLYKDKPARLAAPKT
jgi:predicted DNA binding CopG/RHH family protein